MKAPMELHDPLGDRLRRWAVVVLALLVGLATMWVYLRMSERRGYEGCIEAYAAARTAADSSLVDVQRSDAATGRLDAAYGVSCGELKLRGQLR
jgi:hypothetical protein